MGVWIEIGHVTNSAVPPASSLPSWECGLKSSLSTTTLLYLIVTPFVGVWIEISSMIFVVLMIPVTPFVGVWIEIYHSPCCHLLQKVTPFVGVWIEIFASSS